MPDADQDRWLTYVEIGELFGVTPTAARMYARRRGWKRRPPNAIGGRSMVLVPPDAAIVRTRASVDRHTLGARSGNGTNGADHANMPAIDSLRDQLVIANRRADQAEQRAAIDRARVDELQTALIKTQHELGEERRRVIEILTGGRRRRWWRW